MLPRTMIDSSPTVEERQTQTSIGWRIGSFLLWNRTHGRKTGEQETPAGTPWSLKLDVDVAVILVNSLTMKVSEYAFSNSYYIYLFYRIN